MERDLNGFRHAAGIGWRLAAMVTMAACVAYGVNVREFGARGDAVTDDTEAVRKAFAASNRVHFPAGVYVLTDGIELPAAAIVTGEGAPALGVFPLGDDKRFFAPGLREKLPGTTLLFRGRGSACVETGRRDSFAVLRYAIKTASVHSFAIEKLALALDVEVIDAAGRYTTPEMDQRADFDVGLLVDDSAAGTVRDVAVFGYWKAAGLCIISRGLGDNPDYNTFWNCSFMGEHGVALVGLHDEQSPGLSGTQFYGCRIFANDHHVRDAGQWGTAALYIDGDTRGRRADINGHYFFGGCIRTYNNTAVKLDHASNVSFHGVVFELPSYKGGADANADANGRIVGTANTRDVHLFGCRMHDIGLNELGRAMVDGTLFAFPDAFNSVSLHQAGRVARLSVAHKAGPMAQFTEEGRSTISGWVLRAEADGRLVIRHDNQLRAALTSDGRIEADAMAVRGLSLGPAPPGADRQRAGRCDGIANRPGRRLTLDAASSRRWRRRTRADSRTRPRLRGHQDTRRAGRKHSPCPLHAPP